MLFNPRARKSRLVLLIEHLDAVAYAIEGFEEQKFDTPAPGTDADASEILDYQYELRGFVENIRARELSLIAHVDRARIQAKKMGKYDAGVNSFARLFCSGTQGFIDRLHELSHPIESDFNGNDQVLNFLRTRHLVKADCLSAEETGTISFEDGYLIAGLVPMTDLAMQCESFLHLIENHELLSDLTPDVKVSPVGHLRRAEDDQSKDESRQSA